YLRKGSGVAIEGRLRYRSWETDDGQKRSVVEVEAQNVQFLPRGGEQQAGPAEKSDDYAGIDVPPIEGGEDYPW
ncbi:MAG TPA: single-stranded DNA-binding protein, partial [Candidatus Anoxymicrobiaceae bacterium]